VRGGVGQLSVSRQRGRGGALDRDRRVGDSIEEAEGRESHRGGFMTVAAVG
jgi:hypothetical protein